MSSLFLRFPAVPRNVGPRVRASRLGSTLWLAVLASTACGGGGDDAASSANSSGTAASGVESANAARVRALDATGTWTTVASEGQTFSVAGTQTVRYGAGSSWISMQVTGSGTCSNAAFGSDPVYGVVKQCQQLGAPDATAWTTIAGEGQTFGVAGTQTVRYGAGSSWISMQVTGSGTCSNAAFGSDPVYGVVKQCQLAGTDTTTPTTWTRIAAEGAAFNVSGTQTVRFGIGSAWITRTVNGTGSCTNAFFGSDPAYGVVKECDLATTSGVPAAPVVAGVCSVPIAAVDTSATTATVGNGSPASCTEAALRVAVGAFPVVRFNCGATAATIAVSAPIAVPTNRDTVIDGENRITLDGGGTTRILSLVQANYRTNAHGLTLQHIALKNGRAPAGGYVPQDPAHPSCAYGYTTGSGGAIEVQDATLHVVDVAFENNAAATPGPDVGGGAISAMGSLDVTVAGSTFVSNTGSNSGAVGMLNSNFRVYNSIFRGNSATGVGRNYQSAEVASCPGIGQSGQGGAGGNGGAITIDGGDDPEVIVCGSSFVGNHANELGGALARTPDGVPRRTTLDRSVFSSNTAGQAGAAYLMNSVPLEIFASTFDRNTAVLAGAAHLQGSTFNIVNSTFSGNEATQGVAGALLLSGNSAGSVIQNATFADNKASGGAGYFSAAIFGDSNYSAVNTVFGNNTTSDAYNPMQCGFAPVSGANDVQWPRVRVVGGAADTACVAGIVFADPLLGALADNGGPTPSRAPAPASPLRGAGRNCPATDQRGNPRGSATCTIGAVE